MPAVGAKTGSSRATTKALLLETGLTITHERGYFATGIADVLDACHVPKGSFYHYFKNKEDFGLQVVDLYGERVLERWRSLLEDPATPSPLARIKALFAHLKARNRDQDYRKGCLLGNLSLELGDVNPKFAQAIERVASQQEDLLARVISQAQALGEVNPAISAPCTAGFLIGAWQGAQVRMKTARCEDPMDDFMNLVFHFVLVPA